MMSAYENKLETGDLDKYTKMLSIFSRISEEHFLEGEKRFTQGILKMIINGDKELEQAVGNFVKQDLIFFYRGEIL